MEFEKAGVQAEIEKAKKQAEENRARSADISKNEEEKQTKLDELSAENASIKVTFSSIKFTFKSFLEFA